MRILIVQLRRIGDILLTTPVASYLRHTFPDATIDFLAESPATSVLETNPHINQVWTYDKAHPWKAIQDIRSRRYDAVLDFMNNPRTRYLTGLSGARWRIGFQSSISRLFYNVSLPVPKLPEYVPIRKLRLASFWLNEAGLPSPGTPPPPPLSFRPELYLTEEDEAFATRWVQEQKLNRRPVILIPTHQHPIRRWRADGFRNVGLALAKESGVNVYLAWGPNEKDLVSKIRGGRETELGLLPLTTLRQAAALFKKAALIVTNDSGLMHLAVSVGTPTVTLYGPTRPIDWNPGLAQPRADSAPHDIALNAPDVACLGCHLLKCPIGHLCMNQLKDETVLNACKTLLPAEQ